MSLQIVIRDPSDKEMYELEVNIATGEAQFVTSPPEYKYDINDAILPQETRELLHERELVAMPTEGFRMKIQPLTDLEYGRFPIHCYKKRAGFMIYVVDFGKSATQGKNVHVS